MIRSGGFAANNLHFKLTGHSSGSCNRKRHNPFLVIPYAKHNFLVRLGQAEFAQVLSFQLATAEFSQLRADERPIANKRLKRYFTHMTFIR
jgi:hypothetical protein